MQGGSISTIKAQVIARGKKIDSKRGGESVG
jgi:hypothetical protein